MRPATPADWGKEFLDRVAAVKVVDSLDDAIAHVARYGLNHTEAIVTEDRAAAQRWMREVDASCVLVNASTRFNDGASSASAPRWASPPPRSTLTGPWVWRP